MQWKVHFVFIETCGPVYYKLGNRTRLLTVVVLFADCEDV